MNHGDESMSCGRRIAIAVAIAILLGTLLPVFGNTAQASILETSETTTEGATNPEPAWGQTLIYGTVKYANKNLNGNFLNPDVPNDERYLPIRFAKVELFQYYWVSDSEICIEQTYSTDTGYFYFEFSPMPPESYNQYFVRVYSENLYAEVKNSSVFPTAYTNDSEIITVPANTDCSQYPIAFSSYPDHPAWNILDSVTEAAEWVKGEVNWDRPKIDVFYPQDGAFYHSVFDNIDIEHGWWDVKIYHEYGHAVMAHLYDPLFHYSWPNSQSPHSPMTETSLECAVAEGWAEFFSAAVGGGDYGSWDPTLTKIEFSSYKYEYGAIAGKVYPDLNYTPPFCDAFSLDSNSDGIVECDKMEGNFAGILWDIYDDEYTNDRDFPIDESGASQSSYDDESISLGYIKIWNVMQSETPDTIYEFWNGWFQYSGHASTNHDRHYVKSIYFNHGINPDSSNIDLAYRLPETAPAPNLAMDILTNSNGAYNGVISLCANYITDLDAEDVDFLRCRFEYYADLNGNGDDTDDGMSWQTISQNTSSEYLRTTTWDTSNVSEGYYLLRVVVDDDMLESTNNYSDNPILVDHSQPISNVNVIGPYWNKLPLTITATASSGLSAVNDVRLYYRFSSNNATWTSWSQFGTADTVAPYEWTFTWPAGQGYYQFYTIATNAAGNIESAPSQADVKYGYDYTSPPPPTNLAPTGDSLSPVTFTWGIPTDLSGIKGYNLNVDGTTFYLTANSYSKSLDLDQHTWKVQAKDKADNLGPWSASISFYVIAQPQTGNACGTVKTISGTGISDVTVTAYFSQASYPGSGNTILSSGEMNTICYSTTTDASGSWNLRLNACRYQFTASKPGYLSSIIYAEVPSDGQVIVNFILSPIPVDDGDDDGDDDGCIITDTGISTPSGVVAIEDIQAGDTVLSCNMYTGLIEPDIVYRALNHFVVDDYLLINDCLGLTGNHLIYVGNEIKRADELRQGDILTTLEGNILVSSIDVISLQTNVYNIEVEKNNNYFAEGILVHNVIKYPNFGCPFVYSWDGSEYQEENNILPLATNPERELLDVGDYYLFQKPMEPLNGNYSVRIYEPAFEQSDVDDVQLAIIDYDDPNTLLAITSDGEVKTFNNPINPDLCINDTGSDVCGFMNEMEDGYLLKVSHNETLTLYFPELDDYSELKLIIAHKATMSLLPYHIPDFRWYKCSIHVQTLNGLDEWQDFTSFPTRMNWVLDCADITPLAEKLRAGEPIRLLITGVHFIDYIGLDVSDNIKFDVEYVKPISAKYINDGTDLSERLTEMDQDYIRISPKQGIDILFPFIEQTAAFRQFAFISHGHYYNLPEIAISQPIYMDVDTPPDCTEGFLNIFLEDMFLNTTIQGISINCSSNIDNTLQPFRQDPLIDYRLRVWIEGCVQPVPIALTLTSFRGSQTIKMLLSPGTENLFALEDILWNITGASFNKYSGQYEALNNSVIQFDLNDYYHYGLPSSAEYNWMFGDGSWTNDIRPTHLYTQPGMYLPNLTVLNATDDGRFFFASTNLNVVLSPPIPAIEVYQQVTLSLAVAGRKDNSVWLRIYEDGALIQNRTLTRSAGIPNTLSLEFDKYLGRTYAIELVYDAEHKGTNPTWLQFISGTNSQTFSMEFDTDYGYYQTVTVPESYLNDATALNPTYWFDASGSYDIDGGIVSYAWDFGDGTAATGELVTHTYSEIGSYNVTLTVVDDEGLAAVSVMTIAVGSAAWRLPYVRPRSL